MMKMTEDQRRVGVPDGVGWQMGQVQSRRAQNLGRHDAWADQFERTAFSEKIHTDYVVSPKTEVLTSSSDPSPIPSGMNALNQRLPRHCRYRNLGKYSSPDSISM